MPVDVVVPIRLRVGLDNLRAAPEVVEEALAAALLRAVASSREAALSPRGDYVRPLLHEPRVTWTGEGLVAVDASERAVWEARLSELVSRSAQEALSLRAASGSMAAAPSDSPEEPWRRDRATMRAGGYEVPSYQGGGKKVTLNLAPGSEATFDRALRVQIFEADDPDDWTDGIRTAVALRNHKNKAVARYMRDILLVIVGQAEADDLGRFLTVVTEIGAVASGDDDWDILLEATGRPNVSSAEHFFIGWLARGDGSAALAYLRRRLASTDPWIRWKAARLVMFLLDPVANPVTPENRAVLRRLGDLARSHGSFVSGELGVASLWNRAMAQQRVLADTAEELSKVVARSPAEDPHRPDDEQRLRKFAGELRARSQPASNWATFSSLGGTPETSLRDLERLTARLGNANELALRLLDLVPAMQENAAALRKFIGQPDRDSDEIASLFRLRHEYVEVLTSAVVLLMERQTATGTDDWDARVTAADAKANDFGGYVSEAKLKRITRLFLSTLDTLAEANRVMEGPGSLPDDMFIRIRNTIGREKDSIYGSLGLKDMTHVLSGTGTMFTPPVSVTIPAVPANPNLYGISQGLAWASNLEKDINLFSLDVGLFILYAFAYRIDTVMRDAKVWTEGFREAQGRELLAIRQELADLFIRADFKGFSEKGASLLNRVRNAGEAVAKAAKKELFVHLIITAVAALLTAGAAAIARGLMAGQIIAGIRTAQSAATVVFLIEAGTFTAVGLAGEKLAFGKNITAADAALSFAGNAAFMGVFKVLGRTVGALPIQNALAKLAAPHLANLGLMTGISALHTRIETGRWPENVRDFLLFNLANYAIVAGINAGFRKLVEKPNMDARVKTLLDRLDVDADKLQARFRASVEMRTLTAHEFENLKVERKSINARELELAEFLRSQGHLSDADFQTLKASLAAENARYDSVTFRGFNAPKALTSGTGSSMAIRAIMDPAEVAGLQRIGSTEVYRYDPTRAPAKLETMLAEFAGTGHKVHRLPAGMIRVESPAGETVLVLEAGPAVRGLLPAPVVLQIPPPTSPEVLLNLVIGVRPAPERASIEADLARINPQAVSLLQIEAQIERVPLSAAILALDILVEQRGAAGGTTWNLDAIRGLAEMMRPERAISRATVRRLFLSLSATQLNTLFRQFYEIANSPKVRPGVDFLVRDDTSALSSARRIDLYRKAMAAGMTLPEGMTIESVRGLDRLARDHPDSWLSELGREKDATKRLALLTRLDPIVDPGRPGVGDRLEMVLRKQHGDIRPNVNLLSQPPADVVKAIEARVPSGSGGGFSEAGVREALVRVVRSYQENTAKLQAGANVERNVVGGREEIEAAIVALEEGVEIFQLGNFVKLKINPGLFELPGGSRLVNSPAEVAVQMDVGAKRVNGTLVSVEVTSGELGLPQFLQMLDPQSGSAGTNIDYRRFDLDNSDHRKWLQIIKIYNLSRFATELGRAWHPEGVNAVIVPPEMVIKAGRVRPAARRALTRIGFRIIETNP